MTEGKWSDSSKQRNPNSGGDKANTQDKLSRSSLSKKGFWGSASLSKLRSKSVSSLSYKSNNRSPETEKSSKDSRVSGRQVTRGKVPKTKKNNSEILDQFSEIKAVKSLEDQSVESRRKKLNWRDSFSSQRSKSLPSINSQKLNGGIFEKIRLNSPIALPNRLENKLFSTFDFTENNIPYSAISDSLTKYLWSTETFQDPPHKETGKEKKLGNCKTPLLEAPNNKSPNLEYNYSSFGTSIDLCIATDHPLEEHEVDLSEQGTFGNFSFDIGPDLLENEIFFSSTPSTKASTAEICSSYQSDSSDFAFRNQYNTQKKVKGFQTKTFSNKLKFTIPTSNTEDIPLLGEASQYLIEGFEVPTSDLDKRKFSSMDRPSCLSPTSSEEAEVNASVIDENKIPDKNFESTKILNLETIDNDLKQSPHISSLSNSSCCTNTGNMILRLCVRCLSAVLRIRTVGDSLCFPFNIITSSPKVSILSVLGCWLILDLLLLPFWAITTFFIRELFIYISAALGIVSLGRFIIRMIAFPGSSYRVYAEVEKEFTKYSINLLDSAASNFSEFAAVILHKSSKKTGDLDDEWKKHNLSLPSWNFGKYDVITIYRRTQSFKNRVLGVFLDVLTCLYDENGDGVLSPEDVSSPLNKYGNNKLSGDVGKLTAISMEARIEGRALCSLLKEVMNDVEELESEAFNILNSSMDTLPEKIPSEKATNIATRLLISSSKLKELLSSMKASSVKSSALTGLDDNNSDGSDSESEDGMSSSDRNKKESTIETVKACINFVIPILDPPPHYSIFGLDVLRGCMLSRYIGSKQLWVRRPDGGMIDVIHIPSCKTVNERNGQKIPRAVLYCNPNAGLTECTAGMSLIGGNVCDDNSIPENCWTDFYTDHGFDIFLFNYAGFGRSHGWNIDTRNSYSSGMISRLRRLFCRSFIHFKPTPHSLKNDAFSVASHIINEIGVEKFLIHGESIGGMAAASAARKLTNVAGKGEDSKSKNIVSLLLCDRTFCNLPAVAQRLVGGWTGLVIPFLTPLWSTDVAGDFMKARCPKIVAQDAADLIIHDASSLKSGISISHERLTGVTKHVGLMENPPLEYRMAEWENVGVTKSTHVKTLRNMVIQAPSWPSDKHITVREAFHFAACAKRIGKVATSFKKNSQSNNNQKRVSCSFEDEEQGIEITRINHSRNSQKSPNNDSKYSFQNTKEFLKKSVNEEKKRTLIMDAWKILACCDGMTGMHCGAAVKQGYDCTVTWLYSTVVYGGQVVVSSAQKRHAAESQNMTILNDEFEISRCDFGINDRSFSSRDDSLVNPLPIPEVIVRLKKIMEESDSLDELEIELDYCISMLEYVEKRLMSKQNITKSLQNLNLKFVDEDISIGSFLKLHCGHNNHYKPNEREKLISMLSIISQDP